MTEQVRPIELLKVQWWFTWAGAQLTDRQSHNIIHKDNLDDAERTRFRMVMVSAAYGVLDDAGRARLMSSDGDLGATLRDHAGAIRFCGDADSKHAMGDLVSYMVSRLAEKDGHAENAYQTALELCAVIGNSQTPQLDVLRDRLGLMMQEFSRQYDLPHAYNDAAIRELRAILDGKHTYVTGSMRPAQEGFKRITSMDLAA